jgi:hypothetical protein
MLFIKHPELEFRGLVDDDFSMEKISQCVVRYCASNLMDLKARMEAIEEDFDRMNESIQNLSIKVDRPAPIPVKQPVEQPKEIVKEVIVEKLKLPENYD